MTWKEKEAAIIALEKNGRVDPNDLIEAAKSPNHPCHEDFTWDVGKAAAERWRDQARSLIRRVHFEVQIEDTTERVVMFVPNDDSDDHHFDSLPKIRSKVRTQDVFIQEIKMLHGLTNRVYGIALAKKSALGADKVSRLKSMRDDLAEMLSELAD